MLDWFFGKRLGCDDGPSDAKDPKEWLLDFFGGRRTASGERVTPQTALACVAVKAAVSLLADTIGQLPLTVHKRLPNGTSIPDPDSQENFLLHKEPSPDMSSFIWRETSQGHLGTWGNTYSEIIRDGRGRSAGLILRPPQPSRTKPQRRDDGTLFYEVHDANGRREPDIEARNMLHVPGFGFDGLLGYSPVQHGAEAIGASQAAGRSAAELFANSLQPSGFVTLPPAQELSEDAFNRTSKAFNPSPDDPASGRRHKVGLLEAGATYAQTSMNPDVVQLIETRRFSVEEIARMYRIPPSLLQDLINGTSYASVVELIRAFIQFTIAPWLVRWTAELDRKVLQPNQFSKFNVKAFLMGTHKERGDFYLKMVRTGVLSQNDIRQLEDLPPIGPEGDSYFVSRDLVPLEFAVKEPKPPQPPTPPKPPTPPTPDDDDDNENQAPTKQPTALQQATVDTLNATIKRMLNKEANAAKRAAGTPATMLAWLDEFYDKHRLTMGEAVGPPLEACRLAGVDVPDTDEFVEVHVLVSRGGLLEACEVRASKLTASVAECVDGWLSGQGERLVTLPPQDVTNETKEGNHVQTESNE